jgi:hypothetical protein
MKSFSSATTVIVCISEYKKACAKCWTQVPAYVFVENCIGVTTKELLLCWAAHTQVHEFSISLYIFPINFVTRSLLRKVFHLQALRCTKMEKMFRSRLLLKALTLRDPEIAPDQYCHSQGQAERGVGEYTYDIQG